MKNATVSDFESTVLIVGAKKFMFSSEVQSSGRVGWWGPVEEKEKSKELIPGRLGELKKVFIKHGLARAGTIKSIASSRGAECVEFTAENELFPYLTKVLAIEADPTKSPPGFRGLSSPEVPIVSDIVNPKQQLQPTKDLVTEDQVLIVPVERIRRFEGQPRTYFNTSRIRALGKSMLRVGQKVPVILLVVKGDPDHDYQIYDGERRWKAAKLVGIPALKAIITTSKSDAETFKGSVVCNFGREGHQPLEIANALVKIRREENLTYEELSELSSFSVSKVTQYTGLLKLEPTVQGMMDPELPEDQRISFSVALEIGKVVLSRQVEAARYILDHHLSLTQVRHYIRKLTAEVGVASVYRERSPKDDYNVMQHFLTSATAKAEQIIDLPGKWTVRDLFRNRPPADAYRTVDSLETLIEKLRKLQTSIKNTLPMRRES